MKKDLIVWRVCMCMVVLNIKGVYLQWCICKGSFQGNSGICSALDLL